MTKIKLTKDDARKFILRAHMLEGSKLPQGEKSILKVLKHLKAIQVDSISVAGTNQDISLNSRIEGYVPDHLHYILYKKRKAFEGWLKCLCVLPMEHRPYYIHPMKIIADRESDFLKKHSKVVDKILNKLKDQGPLSSIEIEDPGKVKSYWAGNVRLVKRTLDILWASGDIMISHRKGRIRYFDLTERCAPEFSLQTTLQDYKRRATLDIISALRLFSTKVPTGEIWYGVKSFYREAQADFIKDGTLLEVEIEDINRPFYILREDRKLLKKSGKLDKVVRLIAPLDSLTWDRKQIKDIFNFECSFEIYKPKSKRKYGYYCLFILYGSEFAGRCDIAHDKKQRAMHVHSVYWEDDFKPDERFILSFAKALNDHMRFLGMEKVILPAKKFEGKTEIKSLVIN